MAAETDVDREARVEMVAAAHKAAKRARWALGLNAGIYVAAVLREMVRIGVLAIGDVDSLTTSERLDALQGVVQLIHLGGLVAIVLGGFAFIPWLQKAYVAARQLRVGDMKYSSEDAWSFFVPVLNLFRPYQVVCELHEKLSPADLPEPPPQASHGAEGHYRENALRAPALAIATPAAPVGLWWGLWIVRCLSGFNRLEVPAYSTAELISQSFQFVLLNLVGLAAAIAAIVVVRRIDARIAERNRRLSYAAPEPAATVAA